MMVTVRCLGLHIHMKSQGFLVQVSVPEAREKPEMEFAMFGKSYFIGDRLSTVGTGLEGRNKVTVPTVTLPVVAVRPGPPLHVLQ